MIRTAAEGILYVSLFWFMFVMSIHPSEVLPYSNPNIHLKNRYDAKENDL